MAAEKRTWLIPTQLDSHVFVSYVREDESTVSRLAAELEQLDFAVWLDRARLSPGARWRDEIRKAIGAGAAFIACFSPASEARDRSYMREELALACDELRLRPRQRAWFIPVLLGNTEVPDIPVGSFETLRDLQYVDLNEDWESGVRRLVEALRPIDVVVDALLKKSELPSVGSEERLGALDRAVVLSPRRRDVRRARAHARIATGLAQHAVDDYEEAAPDFPAERAWCYWLAGDADSALALYKRLATQGRATAQDHYDLGCLLYNAARFSEALSAFLDSAGQAPEVLAPRLASLRIMLRGDDHERTAQFTDEAVASFGEHPDLLEAQGLAMIFRCKVLNGVVATGQQLKSYDPVYVVRRLSKAHMLDPENPRRLFRAAMLFFRLRDYANCKDAASVGLKLMPQSSSFRAVLAQVAEYGPSDVAAGLPSPAQLYREAASMATDHLDRDEEMPVFDGDVRVPRPALNSYVTVPLTIAGVVGI